MEVRLHELETCRIRIVLDWDFPEVLEALSRLSSLDEARVEVLKKGHQRVVRMPLPCGGGDPAAGTRDVVVKTYKPPARLPFCGNTGKGKANRAFDAAVLLVERKIGTPPPVAIVEDWREGRLSESHLVCEFVPALSDFRVELNRLFFQTRDCEELMSLLVPVARAVRHFHDAGVIHRDLGNQNIALCRGGNEKWQVFFLDLDRARIFPKLSDKQRGADLARLSIPSEMLKCFLLIYGASEACFKAREREAFFFALHSRLRPFRHPLREYRLRKIDGERLFSLFPDWKKRRDYWIWDECSAQAIPAFNAKDRRHMRPATNVFSALAEYLKHGLQLWRELKKNTARSFSEPVAFDGKIGIALDPNPETWDEQLRWLSRLQGDQKLPLLLRVYHHRGMENWRWLLERAGTLHAAGHAVAFALVQDRKALLAPKSWQEMVDFVVAGTHAFADFYEVGHATNRGKWGIWDFREYAHLLAPALAAKKTFPEIKLTGPACIDFDLHSLPALLAVAQKGAFDALSQHLYVDRRGMPENFQGKFDTVGKCAFHRAMANVYGIADEKIIVSEVNWPIAGTQHWSPVGSPWMPNGPWNSPPSVNEDEYARYLVRYLLLTIASGHVSRVYWWRLAAHGYGLVDDAVPAKWRSRPAFSALQNLLETLKGARFERRHTVAVSGVPAFEWIFEFSRADGSRFALCWNRDSLPVKKELPSAK